MLVLDGSVIRVENPEDSPELEKALALVGGSQCDMGQSAAPRLTSASPSPLLLALLDAASVVAHDLYFSEATLVAGSTAEDVMRLVTPATVRKAVVSLSSALASSSSHGAVSSHRGQDKQTLPPLPVWHTEALEELSRLRMHGVPPATATTTTATGTGTTGTGTADSTSKATACDDAAVLRSFDSFCQSGGVQSAIEPACFSDGTGRGALAVRSVAAGEAVLTIPLSQTITVLTALADPVIGNVLTSLSESPNSPNASSNGQIDAGGGGGGGLHGLHDDTLLLLYLMWHRERRRKETRRACCTEARSATICISPDRRCTATKPPSTSARCAPL